MLSLFLTFFRISALTLGGGYAMVPVMQRILEQKKWMDEKEFLEILSIAQAYPGPIAFNLSRMLGKRLKGFPGAVVSSLAVIIPPFFAIIIASAILTSLKDNIYVHKFLNGVYASLLGIIFNLVYKMIKSLDFSFTNYFLIGISFLAVIFFDNLVIPVFVISIVIKYFISERSKKNA
ncbi:MAG: chromate transporter [Thermotogae bacterium]|nr:chromate transporter [Thermotogota bacterium]